MSNEAPGFVCVRVYARGVVAVLPFAETEYLRGASWCKYSSSRAFCVDGGRHLVTQGAPSTIALPIGVALQGWRLLYLPPVALYPCLRPKLRPFATPAYTIVPLTPLYPSFQLCTGGGYQRFPGGNIRFKNHGNTPEPAPGRMTPPAVSAWACSCFLLPLKCRRHQRWRRGLDCTASILDGCIL